MKKKSELLSVYNSARGNLIFMLVMTVINVVLALLESGSMFLFTAYFPYVAAIYTTSPALSVFKPFFIIFGIVLPLVLTLLCWFITGKGSRPGWMKSAGIILVLDTVFMFYMFINLGIQPELLMDYIFGTGFHAFMIYSLFRGASAAGKLRKGKFVDDTDVQLASAADADTAVLADSVAPTAIPVPRKYVYNKEYAKSKGADKTKNVFLAVFGYLAAIVLAAALNGSMENSLIGLLIILAAIFGAGAFAIAVIAKAAPYTRAQLTAYTVSAEGKLSSSYNQGFAFTNIEYNNMKITENRDECWFVEYTNKKGKTKKAIIPNAYPGLEEYMNTTN